MVRFSPSVIRSSSNHLKTGGENVLHPTPLTQTLVHSISKTRADATLWVIKGYKVESHITTVCGYIFTLTSDRFGSGNTWKVLTPPATDSAGNKYAFKGIVISAPVSDLYIQQNCSLHIQGYTERTDHRATYSSPSIVGCSWPLETMASGWPCIPRATRHLCKASSCSSQRHWTYRPHPLQRRRRSEVAGQVRRGCSSGLSSSLLSIPIVSGPSQL